MGIAACSPLFTLDPGPKTQDLSLNPFSQPLRLNMKLTKVPIVVTRQRIVSAAAWPISSGMTGYMFCSCWVFLYYRYRSRNAGRPRNSFPLGVHDDAKGDTLFFAHSRLQPRGRSL